MATNNVKQKQKIDLKREPPSNDKRCSKKKDVYFMLLKKLSHFGIKALPYTRAAEVFFPNKFNHALKVDHKGLKTIA